MKCATPFPGSDLTLAGSTETPPPSSSSPSPSPTLSSSDTADTTAAFAPGTVIGHRYEILHLLGEGGMGAVYKAHDRELERDVALKLIRTELARKPEILARFKQEIILARQVTHRNVIRIFDFGQADGFRFITMEYLDGVDLRGVLREKGKLPPEEAVKIILQVCRALEAAHGEGVIHRDLKPQNIMLDAKGRAYVMDFGIARSAHLPGMTQTGMLVGTPEYMSPEQAKGEKLDERSDLFSLGVILYELLIGSSPYHSDTPLATLWKRIQEKARPITEVDPTIPKPLSDIVAKALEIEPEKRFSSAAEFAQHLESWLGISPTMAGSTTYQALVPLQPQKPIWKYTTIGAGALLLIAVAALGLPKRFFSSPSKNTVHQPVSVLVADFTNHTGDSIFDDTLEPMFNVALEGASFINAFNRGEAHKLAAQLPHPTDKLDEQPARLVAVGQGIGAVITGELSRRGENYTVSATALDAQTGNVIAKAEATAANKDEVLLTIPKLAAPIRKALGDTTSESAQLQAAGGAFTAASLEVVHQYGIAMQQQSEGKLQDALKTFLKVSELDPNFARAYSGISSAYGNMGQKTEAEKYAKLAMQHIDRMSERERYRLRGFYYLYNGNWQKCTEEYGELVSRYPSDNVGHINIAICYSQLRNWPKAIAEAKQDVDLRPAADGLGNLSLFSSYGGDFAGGERVARRLQQMMPAFEYSYLSLAFAQIGQEQIEPAAESYKKLAGVSPLGSSMAAAGLADLDIYEGRFNDAVKLLDQAAKNDLAAKSADSAANKLAALAYVQLMKGQRAQAVATAQKALASSQAVKIRFLAARAWVEGGELDKAQTLAGALGSEILAEPQAYGKILEAQILLKKGSKSDAIKRLLDANNILNTWIGHFDLGRAYVEAGAFPEATSEFDQCISRRGEVLALFLDEVPSFGYFPPVYYYQGRADEGLDAKAAADAYRKFISIQGKGEGGELLQDAKKRLAKLGGK